MVVEIVRQKSVTQNDSPQTVELGLVLRSLDFFDWFNRLVSSSKKNKLTIITPKYR